MVQGLAFLSKKSWHTKNLANQEQVWIAEQRQAAEKAKTTELARQILQEREQEELDRIAGKSSTRLDRGIDWMYQGGNPESDLAKEDANKKAEEYLLGKEFVGNEGGVAHGDFAAAGQDEAQGINNVVHAAEQASAATTTGAEEKPSANTHTSSSYAPYMGDSVKERNENFRLRVEDPMFSVFSQQRERDAVAEKNQALRDKVYGTTSIKMTSEEAKAMAAASYAEKRKSHRSEKDKRRRKKKEHRSISRNRKKRANTIRGDLNEDLEDDSGYSEDESLDRHRKRNRRLKDGDRVQSRRRSPLGSSSRSRSVSFDHDSKHRRECQIKDGDNRSGPGFERGSQNHRSTEQEYDGNQADTRSRRSSGGNRSRSRSASLDRSRFQPHKHRRDYSRSRSRSRSSDWRRRVGRDEYPGSSHRYHRRSYSPEFDDHRRRPRDGGQYRPQSDSYVGDDYYGREHDRCRVSPPKDGYERSRREGGDRYDEHRGGRYGRDSRSRGIHRNDDRRDSNPQTLGDDDRRRSESRAHRVDNRRGSETETYHSHDRKGSETRVHRDYDHRRSESHCRRGSETISRRDHDRDESYSYPGDDLRRGVLHSHRDHDRRPDDPPRASEDNDRRGGEPHFRKPSRYGLLGARGDLDRKDLGPDRELLRKKREERAAEKQRALAAANTRRHTTKEDRQERLKEMQADARVRENVRQNRPKQYQNEEDHHPKPSSEDPKFLDEITKRTHGVHGELTLASRVAQNRHTNQKLHDSFF